MAPKLRYSLSEPEGESAPVTVEALRGHEEHKTGRAKTTLKAKLLITVALLVTVGLGVADITTYTSLRSFLFGKLDQQLSSSIGPTAQVLFAAYNGVDSGRGLSALVPAGSWGELISPSGARFSVAFVQPGQRQNPPPKLSLGSGSKISIPVNTPFTTVSTTDSSLRYRILAAKVGSGRLTVILAIPQSDLEATLARLAIVTALISLGLLVVLIGLGFYLIGLGLSPLDRMTESAELISQGDFTKRISAESRDVEVERLANALNTMLETIGAAIEQREASEARLKRFVADASHELRTPLTSIRGYAELIESGIVVRDVDIQGAAQRIASESVRMAGLVEDLLLLARLDQARPLAKERVDLSRIVAESVADAKVVEPDRPISEEIEAGIEVLGDDARLSQVVGNLLSNLRAHTSSTTPARIALSRSVADSGDVLAVLRVSDEGPGLSEDQLHHAFERFYRADTSRTRSQGGAGLGLSLVASIVEAHGGSASIASEGPGKGTEVELRIPVANVDLAPLQLESASPIVLPDRNNTENVDG